MTSLGQSTFKLMNEGEYNFYHGFEDMMDEREEKIRVLQERYIEDYWKDQGMIQEALKEAVSEDNTFANLLLRLKAENNYAELGKLTVIVIENYFIQVAREAAEDKISWEQ